MAHATLIFTTTGTQQLLKIYKVISSSTNSNKSREIPVMTYASKLGTQVNCLYKKTSKLFINIHDLYNIIAPHDITLILM